MQVEYTFRDKIDTYTVEAEVGGNRVQIITIVDSFGSDVDYDDFSESEKKLIKGLALKKRDELESLDDEEEENINEEDFAEAY